MKIRLPFVFLSCVCRLSAGAEESSFTQDPIALFSAAASSKSDQREAMFLFIVADLRSRIDFKLFPPAESGSDNPGILLAAIRSNLALDLEPAIARALRSDDKLVERVRTWIPDCSDRYKALWTSARSVPEADRAAVAAGVVKEQVEALVAFSRLLRIPEYWDAYRVKTERKQPVIPESATTAQAIAIYDEWDKVGLEADLIIAKIESTAGTPVLSIKRPNKAPEPTPVSVTPRAKEGTSK